MQGSFVREYLRKTVGIAAVYIVTTLHAHHDVG